MGRFGDKVREARLKWFEHAPRKNAGNIGRRMLTSCQERGNAEGLKGGLWMQ